MKAAHTSSGLGADTARAALAPLDLAETWLNTEPLSSHALRGRVVAVDFWTFSCVNWLRTLPHVRAWADAYRDDGLVVVGVHTPEFGFEHDLAGVRRAVADLDVRHPVAIDNDFAVWRGFANRYWPALYLVGRDGRVGFRHFGEEAYVESERAIQALLGVEREPVSEAIVADGVSAPADWGTLRSPETYLGDTRGERRVDAPADTLQVNRWTLAGGWRVEAEHATADAPGAALAYRFEGRDLNLVVTAPDGPARFAVRLDGEPPGEHHGLDTDAAGEGVVAEPRMYQLVRTRGPVRARTCEITFLDAGVRAHVLTFG